jgi:probable F420-dependent oxidoreductase
MSSEPEGRSPATEVAMNIGVLVVNNRPWATADTIVSFGTRAEALGFDSLWVADQVVIPSNLEPSYPYGRTEHYDIEGNQNFFEALTVLTYLAGRTSRVQLGTSVLVVPYRQPLVVAKQWATLDAFSGGRTILGVGAGFMREQFEALGVDTFDRRGAATDEAIRLFRAVWTPGAEVSFTGEVYRFPPVRFLPKPVRPGGPPIWVGGNGRRSIRRAAELGDGCHSVRIGLDELRTGVATLHELLGRNGRQPTDVVVSAKFRVYARGTGPRGEPHESELTGSAEMMAAKLRSYQAAGLQDMVLDPTQHDTSAAALEAIEFFALEVRPLLG